MHLIIGIDPHKASHTAVAISDREDQLGLFKIPKGLGHEQHGVRYGIVVQADEFLPRSVVIVAPTSRSARQASFRPLVEVEGATTVVLVEQLGAVDRKSVV